MSIEISKQKRRGLLPFTAVCALCAAAIPLINMAVRSKTFLSQKGSPVDILLSGNSQMISMINVIAVVIISCMLYYAEFSGGMLTKLKALPTSETKLYFSKLAVVLMCVLFILLLEAAGYAACVKGYYKDYLPAAELIKVFLFSAVLLMPSCALMLAVSSFCENLWVSLGIGVILIFASTVLPHNSFAWSLFPFSLPFETTVAKETADIFKYIAAALTETALFTAAEALVFKIKHD